MKPDCTTCCQVAFAIWFSHTCAYSAPLISIGPHVDIHIDAEAESKYMSNITMSTNKAHIRDDMILTFTPEAELALFENSPLFGIFFNAKREFIHFLDEDYFNDEPWMLNFRTDYTGDLFSFDFNWNASESLHNINSSPTIFANNNDDIITEDNESFGMNFHIAFTPKTGLSSGVTITETDFGSARKIGSNNLADNKTLLLPIDLLFEIAPKLKSIFGYRYRKVLLKKARDHTDHYINVGLAGDVTAKSDLQLIIGYQNRGRKGTKDKNSLTANLNWKYEVSEKVHFNFGCNRDFGVGSSINNSPSSIDLGSAPSIEITSANLGFDIIPSPSVTLKSLAQVIYSKYGNGRKDLGGRAGTILSFMPRNSGWEFHGSYRYDWNSFEQRGSTFNYKNHNVSLGTSWRY